MFNPQKGEVFSLKFASGFPLHKSQVAPHNGDESWMKQQVFHQVFYPIPGNVEDETKAGGCSCSCII